MFAHCINMRNVREVSSKKTEVSAVSEAEMVSEESIRMVNQTPYDLVSGQWYPRVPECFLASFELVSSQFWVTALN